MNEGKQITWSYKVANEQPRDRLLVPMERSVWLRGRDPSERNFIRIV